MREQALQYLASGLQTIPINEDKKPVMKWGDLREALSTEQQVLERFSGTPYGLGIICGKVSGSLEVIDIDCKYDLTGTLYQRLTERIESALPGLLNTLVVAKSRSGGYHIYYRCQKIAGNLKLAMRETTPEERAADPHAKVTVLIETRGEGGYIIASPTKGYQILSGDIGNIPTITPEQRDTIISVAQSFNEVAQQEAPKQPRQQSQSSFSDSPEDSPFRAYNERGDVVALLESHGWSYVRQEGERVYLKRPGKSDSKDSGNFHEGKRTLIIHSSSTEFEQQKPYSPSDVFILLECNGDKGAAARRLLEMGFGTPRSRTRNESPQEVKADSQLVRVTGEDKAGSPVEIVDQNLLIRADAVKANDLGKIYIHYAEDTAERQVRQIITALESWTDAAIYIRKGASVDADSGETIRAYEFAAERLFRHYNQLYTQGGGSITPEEEDRFLAAVFDTAAAIRSPVNQDRFLNLVLNFSDENGLGITRKSYQAAIDKILNARTLEQQKAELSDAMDKARSKQDSGDLSGAIDLLSKSVQDVRAKGTEAAFASFLIPETEGAFAKAIAQKPDNLETGYIIAGEPLAFPAGAISLLVAPTNHGKTTFLINCLLRAAKRYPKKSFYLFSYEEDSESVTVTTLSIFLGKKISDNNRASIRGYYRDGNTTRWVGGVHRQYFEDRKREFFTDLIETGRVSIKYTDLGSGALSDLIRYLAKYGNAGGVFIDYVQLLRKENFKGIQRAEELKQVCLDLKNAAVNTGLPLILGAQFNREVTEPEKMHSTKIADASDIEKIANVIFAFFNLNKKAGSKDEQEGANSKKAYGDIYAQILKSRIGQTTNPDDAEYLLFDGNVGIIKTKAEAAPEEPEKPKKDPRF